MSAFRSRGAGVLIKLRVEQRLSLRELALVLFVCDLDPDDEPTLTDVRKAIAARLSSDGSSVVTTAADSINEAEEFGEGDEAAERTAWARQMVAKTYRREFVKFPDELAAFEAGDPS